MGLRWLLGAILLIAAVLRLWSVDFGFPGRYRPDEGYLVLKAFRVLQGQFDPNFFVYPSLYIYVIAFVFFIVQSVGDLLGIFGSSFAAFVAEREAVPIYLIGRLTSALLGVVGVLLTYLLGRDAFGRAVGILGAALLAVNFSHARESHFATTDIAATVLTLIVLSRLLFLVRSGAMRDYVIVGGLVGLAVSTKYTAAILGLPCALAAGMVLTAQRDRLTRPFLIDRPLAAIVTGCIAFAVTSPFVFLNYDKFRQDVATYITGELLHGEVGVSTAKMDSGLSWLFGFGLRYGTGYLLAAIGIVGIGYAFYLAIQRRERSDGALILVAFVAAVAISYLSTVIMFFRYMALPMPVLCLLAANVSVAAGKRLLGSDRGLAVAAVVLTLAAADSFYRIVSFNRIAGQVDTRQLARSWIETNIPARDPLIVRGRLKYARPQLPQSDAYISFSRYLHGREHKPSRFRSSWFVVDSHEVEAYSPQPPSSVQEILAAEGTVVQRFSPYANDESSDAVFDQADAFYIPVAGFSSVLRPGPELTVYHVMQGSPGNRQ